MANTRSNTPARRRREHKQRFAGAAPTATAARRAPARPAPAADVARLEVAALRRKIKVRRTIATLARQLEHYERVARRAVRVALADLAARDGLAVVDADEYAAMLARVDAATVALGNMRRTEASARAGSESILTHDYTAVGPSDPTPGAAGGDAEMVR